MAKTPNTWAIEMIAAKEHFRTNKMLILEQKQFLVVSERQNKNNTLWGIEVEW